MENMKSIKRCRSSEAYNVGEGGLSGWRTMAEMVSCAARRQTQARACKPRIRVLWMAEDGAKESSDKEVRTRCKRRLRAGGTEIRERERKNEKRKRKKDEGRTAH